MNLVETSALATIRRRYRIRMPSVRTAIRYLNKSLKSPHPLAERLETDGLDLFISKYGQRVKHDAEGLAIRLFPWTRGEDLHAPKIVAIDPLVSFGKPTVVGTGIRTEVLASRLRAGDSLAELRDDYGLAEDQVEEAIRYELLAA